MSDRLPVVSGSELLVALLRKGYYVYHQVGSHAQLRHSTRGQVRVTIPVHNKDLPRKTLQSIMKQIGIDRDELRWILDR